MTYVVLHIDKYQLYLFPESWQYSGWDEWLGLLSDLTEVRKYKMSLAGLSSQGKREEIIEYLSGRF